MAILTLADHAITEIYYSEQTYESLGVTSSSASSGKSCFAGSEMVMLESGIAKPISEVVHGDRVLAADSSLNAKFSTVVSVPHAPNKDHALFLRLMTETGSDIKVTADHLLLVQSGCEVNTKPKLVAAGNVEVGMCLTTSTNDMAKIMAVESVAGEGLYTVIAEDEFIVVNGFIVSPFATNHAATHAYYNVVRLVNKWAPSIVLNSPLLRAANEVFGSIISSLW